MDAFSKLVRRIIIRNYNFCANYLGGRSLPTFGWTSENAGIRSVKSIVVLTGAGISQESGLATFRDPKGVWSKYRVEDIATLDAFHNNTTAFLNFYDDLRQQVTSGKTGPNPAHYALARLEHEWPGEVTIITQNVDDLHERAGSKNVVHMHGEILKARCSKCDNIISWTKDLDTNDLCPVCEWEAQLRPHVVLFGEAPLLVNATHAIKDCDLFVSIGTSLNVHPANTFVEQANQKQQTKTIELNLEPSEQVEQFDEAFIGPASIIVPVFVSGILALSALCQTDSVSLNQAPD